MTSKTENTKAEDVNDEALDDAQGGIALLLPAVQKVREASLKSPTAKIGTVDAVAQKVRKT